MSHTVSLYVVCDPDQAPTITEKLTRVMVGFGLEGFETGMTVTTEEDEVVMMIEPDDG